jgi:hypothetical protein
MASVIASVRAWYQRRGGRRWLPVVVGESALLVVAAIVGLILDAAAAAPSEPVGTAVQACDVGTKGVARVAFTVHNGEGDSRNYRVQIVVAGSGNRQLGATIVLVNHVAPGVTATSHVLVPLAGNPAGAVCQARAEVFTGDSGHHHS